MRFTVIGHSTLYVEAGGTSVLVDPWLSGSCYWRSWWLFPPSARLDPAWLVPEHVYLTHHHFDHFHFPTLRRLDKGAKMLVPRFGVDVMAGELHGLAFREVQELPHGEIVTIAPGVQVASYQYGFDDTAFVIAAESDVLVDVNDCKVRGRSLERIARDFGRPTFMFKSYSWAQAYPNCYQADDPADLRLISRETYAEDLIAVARVLRPRYAIPFGSMVAFLHPETQYLNAHMVTPEEIRRVFKAADGVGDTELIPMAPSDTWSRDDGFDRSEVDWYTDRETHLAKLAGSVRDKIEAATVGEATRTLSFDQFATYFEGFLRALPPFTKRLVLRRPIVFEVPSAGEPFWILDFEHRSVRQASAPPDNAASIVRVPEAVLADAISKRIVHFIHGSMRLRVRLRPGGVSDDLAFWGVMMIWEIGYLPLRHNLRRRFVEVLWRRRLEVADMVRALWGRGPVLERMATKFATPNEAAAGH